MKARSFVSFLLSMMLVLSVGCASYASGVSEGLGATGGILPEAYSAGVRLEDADLLWRTAERGNLRSLFVAFRKQFAVHEPVVSARVFVAANKGVTLYVNGTKLSAARERLLVCLEEGPGTAWLAGGLYDITELLRDGENVLGASVMPAIVDGRVESALLAQVVLQYEDGAVERISTDDTFEVCDGARGTNWTVPADMGGDDAGGIWVTPGGHKQEWERVIGFGTHENGDVDYTELTSVWRDGGIVSTIDSSDEQPMTGLVTVEGNRLILNGSEYRAIGVNMPNLHQAYNGTWHHIRQIYGSAQRAKEAMVEAIIDAHRNRVAFIRFFASPGYPVDTEKLYFKDPDDYWRQMDEVFDLCRSHNIRLIPSLQVVSGWYMTCGEPKQAILDPSSKTYQATYNYVREFVTRYKDDPVVLMWELENEAFLAADVNMEGRPGLGAGQFPEGSPYVKPVLTLEDSLTFSMMLEVYREWTTIIKGFDSNHPVISGDACVRDTSESLRRFFPGQVWTLDPLEQHLANYIESQTEPIDVFSIHAYGPQPSSRRPGGLSATDYYMALVEAAHSKPAPVFIGELGNTEPHFNQDVEATWTRSIIDEMEREGVSLIALWVWHFPWQPENTLNGSSHPLLMQQMRTFNEKYAGL